MGCQFEIFLPAGEYPQALEAVLEAFGLAEELEQKLSIFLPESEISRINRRAHEEWVPTSEPVFALLQECTRISEQTEGAFDITASPLWRLWGFARKERVFPSQREISSALQSVGYKKVCLDPDSRSVRFAASGMELNLGAIGKGYALDRMGQLLRQKGIEIFLLTAGYSSVLASSANFTHKSPDDEGLRPREPAGKTFTSGIGGSSGTNRPWLWEVGIRDPLRPGRRVAVIKINEGALGTSGSAHQFFRHEGRRFSHVIDPRTGCPVEKILSVTVRAQTAGIADALSTAFYILGPDWAQDFCRKYSEVSALFALAAQKPPGYEWRAVGAWPQEASPSLTPQAE
jgi:thiamine biosynthesis lipoprotein